MKITFVGATKGVTGSKSLLEIHGEQILIDSGLYQEGELNTKTILEDLEFLSKKISAIIITHAHLDHTGFLPYLFKIGYRGPIYLTLATSKLAKIILEDSAKVLSQEKSALYSIEDARGVVSLFRPSPFNQEINHKGIIFKFHKASHILGAAFVELTDGKKTITFSGDLGRHDDLLLGPPSKLNPTDFLVLESTYGNKPRPHLDLIAELQHLLERVKKNKLKLLIPCFALHRSQLLVFIIKSIFAEHPELQMPLYLNSPMMENVTSVYKKFWESFRPHREEIHASWSNLNFLDHYWDIENVNQSNDAEIILASSGMMTGGRIWTHMLDLSKRNDVIIFVPGFQAPGTPGHELISGKKFIRSPEGIDVAINAEVIYSESFSSHADQDDLLQWIQSRPGHLPRTVFLVHGEKEAKIELEKKIESLGPRAHVPKKGEVIDLSEDLI